MTKDSLFISQEDCMGCHACEVACKQEHGLDVGPRLIKILEKPPIFVPVYCHHCENPLCVMACPEEAISKNSGTGAVIIIEDKCNGCKACIQACPFGAIQFNEIAYTALKCDLCNERLKNNEEPACYKVCPARCIFWGDMRNVTAEMDAQIVDRSMHNGGSL